MRRRRVFDEREAGSLTLGDVMRIALPIATIVGVLACWLRG